MLKPKKLTFTLTFYKNFSNYFNFALQVLLIFNIFDKILDVWSFKNDCNQRR